MRLDEVGFGSTGVDAESFLFVGKLELNFESMIAEIPKEDSWLDMDIKERVTFWWQVSSVRLTFGYMRISH